MNKIDSEVLRAFEEWFREACINSMVKSGIKDGWLAGVQWERERRPRNYIHVFEHDDIIEKLQEEIKDLLDKLERSVDKFIKADEQLAEKDAENKKMRDLLLEATGLLNIANIKPDERSWYSQDIRKWIDRAKDIFK